jgi:hypothetical protein
VITDALLSLAAAVCDALLATILGLVPDFAVPEWVNESSGVLAWVGAAGAGMTNWLPINFALGGVAVAIGFKVTGFAVRFVRWVASILTGGGGA